jgi:hypothetical protein
MADLMGVVDFCRKPLFVFELNASVHEIDADPDGPLQPLDAGTRPNCRKSPDPMEKP